MSTVQSIQTEFLNAEARRRQVALVSLAAEPSVDRARAFLHRFCDSEERPFAFLTLQSAVIGRRPSRDFWTWLAEEWPGFDRIPAKRFQAVMRRQRPAWSLECFSSNGQAAYDALPERIPVLRGQNAASPTGLAWTLDRDVAESFAYGHRGIRNRVPIVLGATVAKSDVALVAMARDEAEIVLFASPTEVWEVVK